MRLKKKLAGLVLAGACLFSGSEKADAELIGHWNFNEGSGNIAQDSSGNDMHGDIIGAQYVAGKEGTALQFDGNSYVNIPNTEDWHLQDGFKLSAWIKFDSIQGDSAIVSKNISGVVAGYTIGMHKLRPDLYLSTDPRLFAPENNYNDNQWHNIVGTYDGITRSLYMDDVLVGQSDRVYSNLSSANIRIGGLFKGEQTGAFVGDIDDIRIYNDSISGNPGDVSNIPEPSTFIIWSGLAAAGAGYLASRRKSRVTK